MSVLTSSLLPMADCESFRPTIGHKPRPFIDIICKGVLIVYEIQVQRMLHRYSEY
jgi:hypothetical protein